MFCYEKCNFYCLFWCHNFNLIKYWSYLFFGFMYSDGHEYLQPNIIFCKWEGFKYPHHQFDFHVIIYPNSSLKSFQNLWKLVTNDLKQLNEGVTLWIGNALHISLLSSNTFNHFITFVPCAETQSFSSIFCSPHFVR